MKKHRGIVIIICAVITFAIGLWPLGIIGAIIGPIFLIFDIKQNYYDEENKASKRREQKEKELLRKQNEILLHLIQDEHREDGR